MEFKDFFVMSLIVGLFIFCLVSFSYNLSNQGDSNISILDNPFVNKVYSNVSIQLNTSEGNSTAIKKEFEDDTKTTVLTTLGFALKSVLHAGTTFISSTVNMLGYIFIFGQEIFTLNPIIMGTIMAIVIGLLVLAGWSLIRAGR